MNLIKDLARELGVQLLYGWGAFMVAFGLTYAAMR